MERVSDLQTKLKLLSTPYVETEEYKFFEKRGGKNYDYNSNRTVFFDCRWGYVDQYKNCSN